MTLLLAAAGTSGRPHGLLEDFFTDAGLAPRWARLASDVVVRPLAVLVVAAVAAAIASVGARVIAGTVAKVQRRALESTGHARAEMRSTTTARAVASAWRVAVFVVAFIVALDRVGLAVGPVLAGAGIVGISIGFGAQSLVRDYLNGLFILLEDQYGVGDEVTIGDATGMVESVSLRTTRLRSVDGTVWFFPNGEVRRVGNLSMEFSRGIVEVLVAYGSPIPDVLDKLRAEAAGFWAEPEWQELLIEEPQVVGVQTSNRDGIVLRVTTKTSPKAQARVARELRARIIERLRADGVAMAGPDPRTTSGEPPRAEL